MSRISFVPVADWPEALRSFSGAEGARDIELGITRMLAHAPAAAMGPLQFGAALVSNRTLPERLIELLRLRIAFHNQCRSCMAIRYQRAAADVSEADVCSLERHPKLINSMIKSDSRSNWATDSLVTTSPLMMLSLPSSRLNSQRLRSWNYSCIVRSMSG